MSELLFAAGVFLVIGGAWWAWPPAGVITLGAFLAAAGLTLYLRKETEP